METEILAPAGDEQSARAALMGGADAVYLGLSRFSARESAENFGFDALCRTATLAHLLGAKVYVCLNTLVKDSETDEFFQNVRGAWECGADALLIQDLFLGKALKERFPSLVLHLSTQGGCCNVRGAELARAFGFSRVVLARETPLAEIEKIAKTVETEVFVQGALCACFSGQCYLSSFAGGNSGNRGRCKQPCRKKYSADREGYGREAYALSLSDLSVGEDVRALTDAGVRSLKIEGRLRRPEYVSAAVAYYRALLAGRPGKREFSDLKRAFNRGDYTRGLAFGQGDGLISRKTQGHIGERVGYVVENGFVRSAYPAKKGDGFKILRNGEEVGGGVFRESGEGGFYLSSRERLRNGDEVRLTTDSSLAKRALPVRARPVTLSLRFVAGEPCAVACGDFVFRGEAPAAARSAPLTAEELKTCFAKTDGLPFEVSFDSVETQGAFLPKATLNALRREFYSRLTAELLPAREPLCGENPEAEIVAVPRTERAIIADDLRGLAADVLIYKPSDYGAISAEKVAEGRGRKFLYLPPFFTSEDEDLIAPALSLFEGIYCDGVYGLSLAQERGMSFFAGTGWNITNRFAAAGVVSAGAERYALSKEIASSEQNALSGKGAFALSAGGIKVMDLCFCPFEKTCARCDRRRVYTLKDGDGRAFPLRRYRASGENCRFELYNCAPLADCGGNLHDLTVEQGSVPPTRGHSERSML